MSPNQSVHRIILCQPSNEKIKQVRLLEFIRAKTNRNTRLIFNPFQLVDLLTKLDESEDRHELLIDNSVSLLDAQV